jgi:hypothetical protein
MERLWGCAMHWSRRSTPAGQLGDSCDNALAEAISDLDKAQLT